MNLMFTCAGRRTYLLKYFQEQLKGQGLIVATDMQLSAPALSAADIKIEVPGVYTDGYVENLLKICNDYEINAVISLNDLELPILANNKSKFENIGTKVIVSDPKVIDICFDKYKTGLFIEKIGLNYPLTFKTLQDAFDALSTNQIRFPLILKPRWGSGSIGIEIVRNANELKDMYEVIKKKISNSILSTASNSNECVIIQQFITGQECGVDIMNDLEGRTHGVSVKMKLAMRAGETDKAVTVDDPEIRRIGYLIGNKLGHIGNLDIDIFKDGETYYLLEMNPRFGGGFPFSYEAGVNFPKAIIEWLKGNEIDDSILIPQYNRTFAKCDYLVEV